MASLRAADEVEEQLEWEEYDSKRGVSFLQHMVAGSCAGVAEHLLMYPIDTFKVSLKFCFVFRCEIQSCLSSLFNQLSS